MTDKLKKILDYFRWAGWTVETAHLASMRTNNLVYHCSTPGEAPYTFNVGECDNPVDGSRQVNIILPRRGSYIPEIDALLGIIEALGVEIQHARAPINPGLLEKL